ncbi:MAG: ABC transporter permease [Syntrophomonas sp.]
MRNWSSTAKFWPAIGLLLFLGIWEAGVRLFALPGWLLPSPATVFISLLNNMSLIADHSAYTLLEAAIGYAVSVLLAVFLALTFALSPLIKKLLYPLLILSQTIPLITLAVLFTIWFGWGLLPKVLVVVLVCFFPIALSLMNAISNVDFDLISLFKSMGARPLTIFRMVELPLAMPGLFSGLRISATYSIMAAIIAEWMGAQHGLGYYMILQQKSFAIDRVLAAVLVICLLSLLMVKLVDMLEYLFIPWNREQVRRDYQP